MRQVMILFLLMWSACAHPDMIDDAVHDAIANAVRKPMMSAGMKEDAVQGLSRGLIATSTVQTGVGAVKTTKKYAEQKVYKTMNDVVGIQREQIVTAVVISTGLTQGKVGTQGIKYRFKPINDVIIRPDLMYDWRGRELSSTLNLKWEF